MKFSFTLIPDQLIFQNLLSLSDEERLSDYELCGVYVYNNDDSLVPYIPSEIEIGERKSGECVLQSRNAYAIKWHTHPKKFYPSVTDLFVLYKSVQTIVSIIYSTQGFWILQKEKQKITPITMNEYETFYEYETILYMLGRYKNSEQSIQNQTLKKSGGLYLNPLCLHFIEKYYIPIINKTFGIKATFYKYDHNLPIELTIDITDENLLYKNGATKIHSEIPMSNLVKSMIPKTFTLIEYSIDPAILNYTYEAEEALEPKLKKRKSL